MDEKKAPKKLNIVLRILAFLVTLALIAGAIFLVANRDKLSLDAVKRYFTYRSLERSDSGQAESFDYSPSATDVFASVGNDLLVASTGGVRLYSGGGVCYVEDDMTLEQPAVHVSGSTAAVWSVGGDTVWLYRDRVRFGELKDLDGAILSVRLNSSGWLAVTTRGTGYKAVVSVYDSELNLRMAFRLSAAFTTDAVVTEDCKSLAVISIGQKDASFESTISLYDISSRQESGVDYDLTPAVSAVLGNNVILDLNSSGSVWCVGDSGISVLQNPALESWSYHDWHLKNFAFSEAFTAVLLGKYRAGTQAELYTIDAQGIPSVGRVINEQVLSLSASGKYIAVLTADRLDIYTQNLDTYATLEGTNGAQKVLMHSDGTALLIGSETAHLYVPS